MNLEKIIPPSSSPKYSLNWRDLAKGVLISALTPVAVVGQQTLDTILTQGKPFSSIHLDWKQLLMASIGAGIVYLVKNFFQGPPAVSSTEKTES